MGQVELLRMKNSCSNGKLDAQGSFIANKVSVEFVNDH